MSKGLHRKAGQPDFTLAEYESRLDGEVESVQQPRAVRNGDRWELYLVCETEIPVEDAPARSRRKSTSVSATTPPSMPKKGRRKPPWATAATAAKTTTGTRGTGVDWRPRNYSREFDRFPPYSNTRPKNTPFSVTAGTRRVRRRRLRIVDPGQRPREARVVRPRVVRDDDECGRDRDSVSPTRDNSASSTGEMSNGCTAQDRPAPFRSIVRADGSRRESIDCKPSSQRSEFLRLQAEEDVDRNDSWPSTEGDQRPVFVIRSRM